ncbi:MAG TPA: DsbA family oxidoreductase [Bacteroidia bacterium]|nr:DsbA family oxidoreductase [Bacteroidia bacterium]HRH07398.1 DsbA family oxidoreductase [Bacteroidia bacterium]
MEKIALDKKLKIEIWSDVMCPFCYIGKRKLEKAIADFAAKDLVEVDWKSYQLNPELRTEEGKNIHTYLSEIKGISLERAKQLNEHVTNMAKQVGLNYNMDKAVVANSFDAHRLSLFAKSKGKQNELVESLFRAYFTEGKNTADHAILVELGKSIGLDEIEMKKFLSSNDLSEQVKQECNEAVELGVTGVPFFVFNRTYAVSGAQEVAVFKQVLTKLMETVDSSN